MKPLNKPGNSPEKRTCTNCGKSIEDKRKNAKFCNNTCRSDHWQKTKNSTETLPATNALKGVISKSDLTKSEKEPIQNNELLVRPNQIKFYRNQISSLEVKITNNKKKLASFDENTNLEVPAVLTAIGANIGESFLRENKNDEFGGLIGSVAGGAAGLWAGASFIKDSNNDSKDILNEQKKILQQEIKRDEFLLSIYEKILLQKPSSISRPIIADVKTMSQNVDKPEIKAKKKNVMTSKELMNHDYPVFKFQGRWLSILGYLSTNFFCIVYGMGGEGKSSLAIVFANYLAENFGKALYISGEEGFSKTFQEKFERLGATSDNLFVGDLSTFDEIKTELHKNFYHFVVIDSLDTLKFGPNEMKSLRKLFPEKAFITISQSTKDGKMRGSNELVHDSDVVIQVVDGIATTTKNRFLERGREFEVFK